MLNFGQIMLHFISNMSSTSYLKLVALLGREVSATCNICFDVLSYRL
jgi:hypothetical protein